MSNVLSVQQQKLCLQLLTEGSSIRSAERVSGVHRDTIMRLLVKFGKGCETLLNETIHHVDAAKLELDEQWTFVHTKQARLTDAEKTAGVLGDQYLFLAFVAGSGLIACHHLGKRNDDTTLDFLVKLATRIELPESVNGPIDQKPMFSTDGWASYPGRIKDVFGSLVQHGILIKSYVDESSGRYEAPELSMATRYRVQFVQDVYEICTSHIERFNCTTRQHVKRFTRLTLAFSKKLENLNAAISMHIANYNFVWRSRENGKSGRLRLPAAMQAGIAERLWSFEDLFDAAM